jgi:hypothetical protein
MLRFILGFVVGVLVMFVVAIETYRTVYHLSAKQAWKAAWDGFCMRPLPDEPEDVI